MGNHLPDQDLKNPDFFMFRNLTGWEGAMSTSQWVFVLDILSKEEGRNDMGAMGLHMIASWQGFLRILELPGHDWFCGSSHVLRGFELLVIGLSCPMHLLYTPHTSDSNSFPSAILQWKSTCLFLSRGTSLLVWCIGTGIILRGLSAVFALQILLCFIPAWNRCIIVILDAIGLRPQGPVLWHGGIGL